MSFNAFGFLAMYTLRNALYHESRASTRVYGLPFRRLLRQDETGIGHNLIFHVMSTPVNIKKYE